MQWTGHIVGPGLPGPGPSSLPCLVNLGELVNLREFTNTRDNKILVQLKGPRNATSYEPGQAGQSVSLLMSLSHVHGCLTPSTMPGSTTSSLRR